MAQLHPLSEIGQQIVGICPCQLGLCSNIQPGIIGRAPQQGGAAQRIASLGRNLESADVYDLRIAPEAGVEPVVNAILKQVG